MSHYFCSSRDAYRNVIRLDTLVAIAPLEVKEDTLPEATPQVLELVTLVANLATSVECALRMAAGKEDTEALSVVRVAT